MKIIGGKYRNKNFYMPGDIRPTQNIVRKALFDIIGHDWDGIKFLELCAGSGAVGLEALSRGAEKCVFVERDQRVFEILKENVSLITEAEPKSRQLAYELINNDVFMSIKMLSRQGKKFDIVFIDPPYGRELAKKTLKTLEGYDILSPNYRVIIQHQKHEILPESQGRFLLFKQKKYGSTVLSIYINKKAEK